MSNSITNLILILVFSLALSPGHPVRGEIGKGPTQTREIGAWAVAMTPNKVRGGTDIVARNASTNSALVLEVEATDALRVEIHGVGRREILDEVYYYTITEKGYVDGPFELRARLTGSGRLEVRADEALLHHLAANDAIAVAIWTTHRNRPYDVNLDFPRFVSIGTPELVAGLRRAGYVR